MNADVEVIEMVEPYPEDEKPHYLKFGFEAMAGSKPPIKPLKANPADYDLVIIGSPTWNWRITPPVLSFLHKYPMKGKKIALYVSAGGDGIKCMGRFRKKVKGSEIVGTYIASDSKATEIPEQLTKWVTELTF